MSTLGHSRGVNERVLKWRGKGPPVSAVLDKHWGEEGCVTKKKNRRSQQPHLAPSWRLTAESAVWKI